ncbi:MAG: Ig-like domain-containing protein, partial [Lachnospiraceae bacterium]|nr:Ig-like domain-containing protein [Lachnospiraceae bacterium]
IKKDSFNVSEQVLELEKREVEPVSDNSVISGSRINSGEGKFINLYGLGKFDRSKVADLSAGTLTEKGIMFENGNVPSEITYNYNVSNSYKLTNVDPMHVTIKLVENKNPDNNDSGNGDSGSGNSPNEQLSDPYSQIHEIDGSSADFGSVSNKNAKWEFDPLKSKTVIAVKEVDISKVFESNVSMNGFDTSAKHKYSVDNKKLATVTKKGMLKPKKRGEIEISCWQKQKGEKWTQIGEPVHLFIQLPEMKKKDSISAADAEKIDAFQYLSRTTYRPNHWESTNQSVASVDDNGEITIHKKGSTKIIAVYGEGKQSSKKKYKTTLKVN